MKCPNCKVAFDLHKDVIVLEDSTDTESRMEVRVVCSSCKSVYFTYTRSCELIKDSGSRVLTSERRIELTKVKDVPSSLYVVTFVSEQPKLRVPNGVFHDVDEAESWAHRLSIVTGLPVVDNSFSAKTPHWKESWRGQKVMLRETPYEVAGTIVGPHCRTSTTVLVRWKGAGENMLSEQQNIDSLRRTDGGKL